jgi:hypothetical protein
LLGTSEPKPALLDGENLSKLIAISREVDAQNIREHLSAIVGPRNRFTSKEKARQVENYILEEFEKYGWNVERQEYDYNASQSQADEGGRMGTQCDLEGVNIIAEKLGTHQNQLVIVGAHYDTVDGSPGADDNGTGISALLELARILGKHGYSKTLLLVAFDMEETGYAGSEAFVKKLPPNANVEGTIIFEMLGYLSEKENSQKIPSGLSLLCRQQIGKVKKNQFKGNFMTVIHNGKSKKLASLVAGANRSLGEAIPLVFIRDPLDLPIVGAVLKRLFPALKNLLRSDHIPFWKRRFCAVQVTDTANFRNPNYHRPTDTVETVNFSAVQRVVQTVAVTVGVLAGIEK